MMTPAVCQKFLAGGGFCPRHFWLATHLGLNFWSVGAVEIANLCKPLVAEARMLLNQSKGHRRPTRLRLPWNRRTENRTGSAGHDCIFCHENRNREQGLIKVLEGLLDEEDFAHPLATNGLCLPHAQSALHAWNQSSKRKWVEGLISQHMAELTRDLDEFIRKYEHRHRHEPFGREVHVVRRAMEFIVGLDSYMSSGKSG